MAPVCLFVFNRPFELKRVIGALRDNYGSENTDLVIFSDGARNDNDLDNVNKVRRIIRSVEGFRSVRIVEREENFGLARSVISGVTSILREYKRVIVLEDDLVTSRNFLAYMNSCLGKYEAASNVWSVSGFSFPVKPPKHYQCDAYFNCRASSWGWATWLDRWDKVDWSVADYDSFMSNHSSKAQFSRGGSDLVRMLRRQMEGKIDSWAIRFCYAQFKNGALDVCPIESKVVNIGFSDDATHTKSSFGRFDTLLDNSGKETFLLPDMVVLNEPIVAQVRGRYGLVVRLYFKLKSTLYRVFAKR